MTIEDRVAAWARRTPEAPAILAPGRGALNYAGLHAVILETVRALNSLGVGRGSRVAVALPNGPEMATAFLGIASTATCAPLNPAYRAAEFEFYLADLGASALVVPGGADSPAREAAGKLGVPLIELTPAPGSEAGIFTLSGQPRSVPLEGGLTQADDTALVLHTSGTTSRPKLVPLTQANLCVSADNVREALALASRDRCLSVMPLFHIHGLIAGLLASLASGASVVSAPGLNAPLFFDWMEEFQPTWYTAVPTMHQAVLERAGLHGDILARRPLRFIRSSSAALPPKVMTELEQVFRAPVIEAYGMTEAAHQMASNPLPPGVRKPGSVGLAAGPEIAIMGGKGKLLPRGATGEVVIRGPNVTAGYEANPSANEQAFTQGWFRTGDQGCLDEDGYLFLTDRLKEIINRGGEKVSPREVDEVLLSHPAVAQALTFAIPDRRLGEEVGAVLVLRPNTSASEREIREFAAGRLAGFKVPRRLILRDEIPKGPTGKLQRIGLASKLGIEPEPDDGGAGPGYAEPRTPLESKLAGIWQEVLRLERVGIHDDFLHLGGDSILATQIVSRIVETFQAKLSLITFFEASTVARLAAELEKNMAAPREPAPAASVAGGTPPTRP